MKNILAALCLLIQPCIAFSQTQKDYENVVGKFMKFYNLNKPDSIINLYSDSWGETKKKLWDVKKTNDLTERYGRMKSYKYLELYRDGTGDGGGDGLAFFKVVFTKSTHVMGITLDKQNYLLTFRFKTSSPHIDSLLERYKNY